MFRNKQKHGEKKTFSQTGGFSNADIDSEDEERNKVRKRSHANWTQW